MSSDNQPRTPQPGNSPEQLKLDLAEFGYCLVAAALEGAELGAVQKRLIDQARAELNLSIDYKNPGHLDNQWVNMLINKGEVFERLVLQPLITQLVEYQLGPDFLLSCCDAQIKHPGAGAMPLHTDQWWMPPPADPSGPHAQPAAITRNQGRSLNPVALQSLITPPAVVLALYMVTEFTEQNGATRLIPRSHLSGQQPDPAVPHPVETIAAQGPAGTAIVFDGRLWHAAGRNDSQSSRYGITCAYCGPQFRPLENYTRGLRPEVLQRAAPELVRRLGFKAWSTYGHTGDPDLDVSLDGAQTLGALKP